MSGYAFFSRAVSLELMISLNKQQTSGIQGIRKTCPCNVYPLEPYFYIVKLGYAGVYLFFLFLLQNINCGYSLESSNVYPQSMF